MIAKLESLSSDVQERSYAASRSPTSARLPAAADQALAEISSVEYLIGPFGSTQGPLKLLNNRGVLLIKLRGGRGGCEVLLASEAHCSIR